jgi:Lipase (class 3)
MSLIIVILIVALALLLAYNLIIDKIKSLEIQSYKRKCMERYFSLPLYPPTVTTDRYDSVLAKYLLGLSLNVELSNCSKDLGPLPPVFGFSAKEIMGTVLGKERMLGYVYTSPKAIIIVFTGTVFVDEWTEDAEVSQVPITNLEGSQEGQKAHKGFYDMYVSLQNALKSHIEKVRDTQNIYITGHSLGGALSTLAAFDLNRYEPVIYTFAAPRVFNIKGAQKYNNLVTYTYRIHNTEDIFTSLPLPVIFGIDYEHVGSGGIPFTDNLGSMAANHTDAYVKHLKI